MKQSATECDRVGMRNALVVSVLTVVVVLSISIAADAASECTANAPPCFVTGEASVLGGFFFYPNIRSDLAGKSSGDPIYIDGTVVKYSASDVPSWRANGDQGRTPVYYPLTNNNGYLFVMLPGTGNDPWQYREILRRAASMGYHAMGLNYWNDNDAAMDRCNNNFLNTSTPSRDSCITSLFEGTFKNIDLLTKTHRYTGFFPALPCYPGGPECGGTTTGNALNDADPMRHRLRRTLTWLAANFPNQGWEQFAGDHAGHFDASPYIDWSKVVLAGHSTGSKFATHIAKVELLHKLIVLSGPHATFTGPWMTECASAIAPAGATGTGKMYFYDSTYDSKYGESLACQTALGFGGAPVDIGLASSPYGGGHRLVNGASAPVNDCGSDPLDQAHRSTARDCALTNGGSVAVPSAAQTFAAWDYLMQP